MTLTRLQKIGLAFFVFTLVPAYLFANWRHSSTFASLDAAYTREQALHQSTDKLLSNCERSDSPYDANQQICNQGQMLHTQTSQAMDVLAQEKLQNDSRWHLNFWLTVLLLNFLGWGFHKARLALSQE
jgi:hypothetical protein